MFVFDVIIVLRQSWDSSHWNSSCWAPKIWIVMRNTLKLQNLGWFHHYIVLMVKIPLIDTVWAISVLRMVVIAEDKVSDFDNHAGLVCSTINIVDRDRGCVGMLLDLAHSMLIKHLVTLQSMRAWVHRLTAVSINSISMSMVSDIDPGLAATTYLPGNWCSQAGRQLH
jgi:hypothetical protein